MSLFQELRQNPLKIVIKKDAREVIFTTISSMCDNKSSLQFKKDETGEFKINGCGNTLSNWQMKHDSFDLTWAADEGKWQDVIKMINTGVAKVASVRQR